MTHDQIERFLAIADRYVKVQEENLRIGASALARREEREERQATDGIVVKSHHVRADLTHRSAQQESEDRG